MFIKTQQIIQADQYAELDKIIRQRICTKALEKIEEKQLFYRRNVDCRFNITRKDLIIKLSKLGTLINANNIESVIGENFVLLADVVDSGGDSALERGIMFSFYSRFEDAEVIELKVKDLFSENNKSQTTSMKVSWGILQRGDLNFVNVHNVLEEVVYDEAYPYIVGGVDKLFYDYMNSSASILILMGKPGMGKTRLLRYLMQKISAEKAEVVKVLYTMEEKIFSNDSFFLDFLTEGYDAMILEDIDLNLKSRASGNQMMHKLLAGADGFVKNKRGKIILTTNIVNIGDIDEALIREGRCFKRVDARYLTSEEANKLLKKINSNSSYVYDSSDRSKITVANVYNMSKLGGIIK